MLKLLLQETTAVWQTKDTVTLVASIIALVFSIITLYQKKLDKNAAMRKQLTDTLEKLTMLNIENEKFNIDKTGFPTNYAGLLNDQRRFFVRQAAAIAKEITGLVYPFEWSIIAWSYNRIDETEEAGEFFQLAMKNAKTAIDKGLANRSYAVFLSQEKSREDAAPYFTKALKELAGNNDRLISYRAETYKRWANTFEKNTKTLYNSFLLKAIEELRSLANKQRSEAEIATLENQMAK
jgi:tetratricopeptide (TPR) repeat protein